MNEEYDIDRIDQRLKNGEQIFYSREFFLNDEPGGIELYLCYSSSPHYYLVGFDMFLDKFYDNPDLHIIYKREEFATLETALISFTSNQEFKASIIEDFLNKKKKVKKIKLAHS